MTRRLTSSSLAGHVAEAGGRGDAEAAPPCWRRSRRRRRGSARRRPPAARRRPVPASVRRRAGAGRRRRRGRRGGGRGAARRPRAVGAVGAAAGVGRRRAAACGSRRRTPASSRSPTCGSAWYCSYISSTSQAFGPNCSSSAIAGDATAAPVATLEAGSSPRASGCGPVRCPAPCDRRRSSGPRPPWASSLPLAARRLWRRRRRARALPRRPRPRRCRRSTSSSTSRPTPRRPATSRWPTTSKGQQVHSMVAGGRRRRADPRLPTAACRPRQVGRAARSTVAGAARYATDLRHPRPRGRRHGRRARRSAELAAQALEDELREEPEDRPQHEAPR